MTRSGEAVSTPRQSRTPYDESTYLNALKCRGSPHTSIAEIAKIPIVQAVRFSGKLHVYDAGVARLYALDPSAALLGMAREKRAPGAFPVEFLERSAEEIPLEARTIDTVVTTWTLCSVPDALRALREARRVLEPGGALLFVEHGLAPDPRVERWQRRLNPYWRRFAGGCNLDRRIDRLVREAGFEILDLETEYAKGPRPFTYTYCGRARPA